MQALCCAATLVIPTRIQNPLRANLSCAAIVSLWNFHLDALEDEIVALDQPCGLRA